MTYACDRQQRDAPNAPPGDRDLMERTVRVGLEALDWAIKRCEALQREIAGSMWGPPRDMTLARASAVNVAALAALQALSDMSIETHRRALAEGHPAVYPAPAGGTKENFMDFHRRTIYKCVYYPRGRLKEVGDEHDEGQGNNRCNAGRRSGARGRCLCIVRHRIQGFARGPGHRQRQSEP